MVVAILWLGAFDRCYNTTEILNVRLYLTEFIIANKTIN